MKLHLGCGPVTPAGWLNVDGALGARLARVPFWRQVNRRLGVFKLDWNEHIFHHDLTTPFPWPDASADAVYSSHTLEHLTRADGLKFLTESHRVLKPGSPIRIVVPDLRCYVDDYQSGALPAEEFVEALGVLNPRSGRLLRDLALFMISFPHKCMYDAPALVRLLSTIGFTAASRAPFDSDIAGIRDVEMANRVGRSVIVEGRKQPVPAASHARATSLADVA